MAVFSFIGVVGTFVELSKNKYIKGLDDLGVGLFCFILWLCCIKLNIVLINVFTFLLLIMGIYGLISGIIKIIVSIFYGNRISE